MEGLSVIADCGFEEFPEKINIRNQKSEIGKFRFAEFKGTKERNRVNRS